LRYTILGTHLLDQVEIKDGPGEHQEHHEFYESATSGYVGGRPNLTTYFGHNFFLNDIFSKTIAHDKIELISIKMI